MAITAIPVPLHVIGAHRHQGSPAPGVVRAAAPAPKPAAVAQTPTAQAPAPQAPAAQTSTTATVPTSTATQTTSSTITQTTTSATQSTATQTTTTATQTTTAATQTSTTAAALPVPVAHPGWSKRVAKPAKPRDLVLSVHQGDHSAHVAGDPGDTISDFKFSPASITIHVGDTIMWTNNGPTAHTATANDHSFDTGTLQKGQSASHTFTQAGTFPYICTIHPFMHGTVVVLASTTSTTPAQTGSGSGSSGSGSTGSTGSTSTSAATTTTTTPQATTASGPTLPVTGLNLVASLFAAAALVCTGIFLRRRFRD